MPDLPPNHHTTDTALIGAGPIGLELAVNLKAAGVDYLHLDAQQVGHTVTWYPKGVQFFSSPQRIAIAGVPLVTPDQSKATREQYLAYLRGIVEQFGLDIQTFQRVESLQRDGEHFMLTTRSTRQPNAQSKTIKAKRVVLAVGDMHAPRKLGIAGEDLPHVSHYFDEPHQYFHQRLLIVGGRNSAVEAAIRCQRAGADVTLSYRRGAFDDKSVKYWIKPEIDWLIKTGAIKFHPRTLPTRITPDHVELSFVEGEGSPITVPADFVLLLTGYVMDTSLLEQAGVELHGENRAPRLDHATMSTNVPGLYVVGTAAAGTQVRFKLFIENAHSHVVKVVRDLTGQDPPHVNPLAWERLHEDPLGGTKHAES